MNFYKVASRKMQFFLVILLTCTGITTISKAQITGDYRSAASGNWSAAGSWQRFNGTGWVAASTAPTSADGVVTIQPGNTITIDVAATASSVSLTGNGTNSLLTINGSNSLNITGNLLVSAAAMTGNNTYQLAVGAGTLTVGGNITITGGGTANRIALLSASTGTINVGGNLAFTGGTLSAAQLTFSAGGILNIGGSLGTTGAITFATSTVNFNGTGAQTVPALNYFNLSISGNRTTNSVTLANGGTIGIGGSFTPSATFTTGNYIITGNTISFNSSSAQTIPAFNYNNITSTSTGGRTLANSGTIGIAGTFSPGTNLYTVTGSTVNFNGSGSTSFPVPNVSSGDNYNNVTISSGTRTMSSTSLSLAGNLMLNGTGTFVLGNNSPNQITIRGNLDLNGGDFDFCTGNGNEITTPPAMYIFGNITESNINSHLTTSFTNCYNANIFLVNTTSPQTITYANPQNHLFINYIIESNVRVNLGSNIFLNGYNLLTYAGTITLRNNSILDAKTFTISQNGGQTNNPAYFNMNGNALLITAHPGGINGSISPLRITRTFSATASYIFNGLTPQAAGMPYAPFIANNITIDNASDVTMDTTATVNGLLSFIKGRLNIRNFVLTIGSTGSITGFGSTSYIITGSGTGRLRQNGLAANAAEVFPIGTDTYYLPATLTPYTAGSDFSLNVFSPSFASGVPGGTAWTTKTFLVDCTWNIEQNTGASNADVRLEWNEALQGSFFTTMADSEIAIWRRTSGTNWLLATSNFAPNSQASNFVTGQIVPSANFNTQFMVGWIAGILADETTLLSGNRIANKNILKWENQNTQVVDHFELERSNNGNNFGWVATISANRNNSYQWEDVYTENQKYYYRLKIVYSSGRSQYSNIVVIDGRKNEYVKIAGSGSSTISLYYNLSSPATYSVYASSGSLVLTESLTASSNTKRIHTEQLAAGIYFIEVVNGTKHFTLSFLKP